ncbi:hypothetical protein Pme01_32540 [Planosporangium mesophilum]|uniref:Helix-hairpin-helix domain-containing protein n=1 Tax=Planosporangium mesophilum TaxID=689768 RepID=A0A8J3TD27_9ACTN|nr:hypothetical protein Pme01_32540 [Planosporangium mesophilum]
MPDRRPTTWWWFLIPLLTCGIGTFVMVLIGGLKLRSRLHTLAAVGYFLLTVVFFVGAQFTKPGHTGAVDAVIIPPFLIISLGGIAHTIVLQMKVRGAAPIPVVQMGSDPALAAAQWRAQRRQEARALITTNPPLAAELRIGRPDAPGRQYDDGGLVDVNHVPAAYLVSELDLTPEAAAEIVSERDRCGGFSSPEELVVYCSEMTPERLAIIRDRLVFIPF